MPETAQKITPVRSLNVSRERRPAGDGTLLSVTRRGQVVVREVHADLAYPPHRVHGVAVDVHLVVQVRPEGVNRVADQRDLLTGTYPLTLGDRGGDGRYQVGRALRCRDRGDVGGRGVTR